MKKKVLAMLLSFSLVTAIFAGCGSSTQTSTATSTAASTAVSTATSTETSMAASKAVSTATSTATSAASTASTSTVVPNLKVCNPTGEKYKIGLTNSYMGNDWRQEMLKAIQVAANRDEYKNRVDLTIVNTENTAEAQSAAIDAMVEQGYDAILIDAVSTTALTAPIQRAINAGIVCVTFDCMADVEGIYKVSTDFSVLATGWANYLVQMCGKGSKVAIDTGLSGSTVGNTMYDVAKKIFADNGIEVVAEFSSEFADGVGQQQLESVLAANPDLNGVYAQFYGEGIQKAFENAGREYLPCAAYTTNGGSIAAIDNNMPLLTGVNFAGQSVIAMDEAIQILDGETVDKEISLPPNFYYNGKSVDIGVGYDAEKMEKDVNCWEKIPGELMLPSMPTYYPFQESADEVSDYLQK